MNRIKKISLLILFFVFLSGCLRPSLFKETRILMDTFLEISCVSSDRETALFAMKEALGEVERIERLFSKYEEKSIVSKINLLAGKEKVKIPFELFKIIEDAVYYSKLSKGSFDITVGTLVDIWGDARKKNALPDLEAINMALKNVGYKNIVMDKETLSIHFLNKDTKIDLGGIAKGYAVDRAKEVLSSYGIENALINLGGNIFAMGSPPNKESWHIGIQDPRDRNKIVYRLSLKDKAVSTSGDYERFFMVEGKRFSHIINPLNGMPSEGVISVTVVADSAKKADILSTAVFVMGAEEGIELIRSFEDTEVFIFDSNKQFVRYPLVDTP